MDARKSATVNGGSGKQSNADALRAEAKTISTGEVETWLRGFSF